MPCVRCVRCGSDATWRDGVTRLGSQRWRCRTCRRRFTARSASAFSRHGLPDDVIALAVRRYARFGLSYADVAEMLAERGFLVDRSTVYRWVQRFLPLFGLAARRHRRPVGNRWRVDETYCAFNGSHAHICRAIDQDGQVVDASFSERRNAAAAQAFFERAMVETTVTPERVASDKARCYPPALPAVLPEVDHRRSKRLNIGLERDHGLEGARTLSRWRSAPRPPSQIWCTFLRNHAPQIWAADLFTVPTLRFRTLYVLLQITHGRLQLVDVNVTAHPTAAWVCRQLVEATAWGRRPRHLVPDRDAVYSGDVAGRANVLGIETVLTPVRAPRANAIAERVVRTLRNDCLDHLIPLNEAHLRAVLAEFVPYDNTERPHRSLLLEPPLKGAPTGSGPVRAKPVLGGLHHVYRRAA